MELRTIFKSKIFRKSLEKHVCHAILVMFMCFTTSCNREDRSGVRRYHNPRNIYEDPAYDNKPYSGRYSNPYATLPKSYPYYDQDQYYVPPKGYSTYGRSDNAYPIYER